MIKKSSFKPAWWLPGGHLQTIAPIFLPKKEIQLVSEDLDLPDGDFIELSWTEIPAIKDTRPIIIVLHGIEGSVNSHYAKTILTAIKQREWIGLFMHFRGCGQKPNRKAASYHSGSTEDVRYLINNIARRYPNAPLGAIGFSLGGNVLTKLLGEPEDTALKAGVVICAPLNLATSAEAINKGASKIYRNYLLEALKAHLEIKINRKMITHISSDQLRYIKTIREFDHHYTVPVHGFESVDQYYAFCSGWRFLKSIKKPTLILHAANDPFVNSKAIPLESELSDAVVFEVSRSGGHIGFISGSNPLKPNYWFSDRALNFLNEQLFIAKEVCPANATVMTFAENIFNKLKRLYSQRIRHFLQ